MATYQSVFIPATTIPTKIAALGATTASSIQTFSKYAILAIEATGNINVTFGNAAGPAVTATATGWLIQSGAVAEFELGSEWDSVWIYNPGASAVDVYIYMLSRA
jgi:hypothetical protein